MTALSINTRVETGGAVVITVRGDVEFGDAARIHDTVRDAVSRYRPSTLCLDLGLVTFMATEATPILPASQATAQASGTRLVIRNPSQPVRRLLDLYAVRIPLA